MEGSFVFISPAAAGMSETKLQEALLLLDQEVTRGEIPGGVVLVGRHGSLIGCRNTGFSTMTDTVNYPAEMNTIYDCASLTKVVVTLPLVLILLERGKIRLNDTVSYYLPAFSANGKSKVTIKHLLTHTSGLPAYRDFHSKGWTVEEIKNATWEEPLQYEPGTDYVYSDLGYITLGVIAELLLEKPLNEAAREHIFTPLGMHDSGYLPDASLRPRIAATERLEDGYRWGEVHDGNASALNGVSGHAGLFSTAFDLAQYAMMWLNQGMHRGIRFLSQASIDAALKNYAAQTGNYRGLGWVLKGDRWDASGDLTSSASYSHTGFTGVSLWLDPATQTFAVLLTNRVLLGRDKSVVRLRDCLHNSICASIER